MHVLEGKGSSPIKLTEKKIAWSNLNLLSELTGKNKKTIAQWFYNHKKKPWNYEDVAQYIINKYSIFVDKQSKSKPPPE